MHEMSEGYVPFFKRYVLLNWNRDTRQLFHAPVAFRAFDLARSVQDLILPNNGVIAHVLRDVAWSIKSTKDIGQFIRYLKKDPLFCQDDQTLLVEAYKIFARRTQGWSRKKTSTGDEFVKNK